MVIIFRRMSLCGCDRTKSARVYSRLFRETMRLRRVTTNHVKHCHASRSPSAAHPRTPVFHSSLMIRYQVQIHNSPAPRSPLKMTTRLRLRDSCAWLATLYCLFYPIT